MGHKSRWRSDLSTTGSVAQDSQLGAFCFVLYPEAGLQGMSLSTAPGRGCQASGDARVTTQRRYCVAFNQEGCTCSYLPQTALP